MFTMDDSKVKESERNTLVSNLADLAKFPEINPGPVCRLDKQGMVVLANKAACRLFEQDHLVGLNWMSLCPSFDRHRWKHIVQSVHPENHEAEIGASTMMFTFVRPEESDFIYVFGADITGYRQAQQQLAEQAAALKEVARFPDMNPGPVLRVDLEGYVLLANSSARRIFGDTLVGSCWRDIFPGLDSEMWSRILAAISPIPLEAHIGECDYVFAHRRDQQGKLVFVFGSDITHQKRTERALHQSEKMATLGTLAAGVAHELNNPAAATRRAADQLRRAFARLTDARLHLHALPFSTEGMKILLSLEQLAQERATQVDGLDPLTRSDRESAVEEFLEEEDIPNPWDLSPSLVGLGLDPRQLRSLKEAFQGDSFQAALIWLSSSFLVYSLLHEISQGSTRISEIVSALKNYSYLGQAPIQAINIHEGLDNTLVILRNKLKTGINVRREYSSDVPPVVAYGSELNQVWTNLLDNAADALGGKGEITIRTRREDAWVIVEVEDNGPGIPEDIQSRIFDPFFTTKDLGKGTGLGLSTSYGIITEKHKGALGIESRPGLTRFTVRLPVEQRQTSGSV